MGLFLKRIIRRIKYFPIYLKEARSWEYESCKRCGSIFRLVWTIDNELWKKVMDVNDDGGGSVCIDCFIKLAENKNVEIKNKNLKIDPFYPNTHKF